MIDNLLLRRHIHSFIKNLYFDLLSIEKANYVCRNNLMHLFEILCECVVYNYKSKLESNISTDLIDINANLRPLMETGK